MIKVGGEVKVKVAQPHSGLLILNVSREAMIIKKKKF